jgi:hypothetical protein
VSYSGQGSGSLAGANPVVSAGSSGSAVSIHRYAEMVQYDRCLFNGVSVDNPPTGPCNEFWLQSERERLSDYLLAAQAMIEDVVKYPLCPTYVEEEISPVRWQWQSENKYLIEAGIQAEETLESGSIVDYGSDPATVGPITIASGVTADQIRVFHEGTSYEIPVASIAIDGTDMTLYIHRCHLVSPQYWNQDKDDFVLYSEDAKFVTAVDVKRYYTDNTTQATLYFDGIKHVDTTQTARLKIIRKKIGTCRLVPANYDATSQAWTDCIVRTDCGEIYKAEANYKCGLQTLPHNLEQAVLRLAHSLMPEMPCSCSTIQRLWKRDRNTPLNIDTQRQDCPFGMSDGAWFAWTTVRNLRVLRAGVVF